MAGCRGTHTVSRRVGRESRTARHFACISTALARPPRQFALPALPATLSGRPKSRDDVAGAGGRPPAAWRRGQVCKRRAVTEGADRRLTRPKNAPTAPLSDRHRLREHDWVTKWRQWGARSGARGRQPPPAHTQKKKKRSNAAARAPDTPPARALTFGVQYVGTSAQSKSRECRAPRDESLGGKGRVSGRGCE